MVKRLEIRGEKPFSLCHPQKVSTAATRSNPRPFDQAHGRSEGGLCVETVLKTEAKSDYLVHGPPPGLGLCVLHQKLTVCKKYLPVSQDI